MKERGIEQSEEREEEPEVSDAPYTKNGKTGKGQVTFYPSQQVRTADGAIRYEDELHNADIQGAASQG